MPVLVGLSIDYRGKTFDLHDAEITVGRNEENVITLHNASISGRHCVFTREAAMVRLKDLNSTNGTRVNGIPITETVLRDQDVIHLGTLEFVFADQSPERVDVENLRTRVITPPTVEVTTAPVEKPASFSSFSPFASASKTGQKTWVILITVIAVLALACVGLLFFLLFTAGS